MRILASEVKPGDFLDGDKYVTHTQRPEYNGSASPMVTVSHNDPGSNRTTIAHFPADTVVNIRARVINSQGKLIFLSDVIEKERTVAEQLKDAYDKGYATGSRHADAEFERGIISERKRILKELTSEFNDLKRLVGPTE